MQNIQLVIVEYDFPILQKLRYHNLEKNVGMLDASKVVTAIHFVVYTRLVAEEAGVTTLQSVRQVQVVLTSIVVREKCVSDHTYNS